MEGGGYFENTGTQSGSQNDGASKKTIRPIRALMISQVLSAKPEYDRLEGDPMIDESPVNNAVICVQIIDVSDTGNGKRLKVADSTGTTELRLGPFNKDIADFDSHINDFANVYGYFRSFQGKQNFDVLRVEFEIHPYQFLYHEVEAARESYHYQGLVPLGQSVKTINENSIKQDDMKAENDEPMFVNNDEDIKDRILGIIRGFEDSGDGVSTDYIANELHLEEGALQKILFQLQNDAQIYEVDSRWRVI